jgi:hypothetical protein
MMGRPRVYQTEEERILRRQLAGRARNKKWRDKKRLEKMVNAEMWRKIFRGEDLVPVMPDEDMAKN